MIRKGARKKLSEDLREFSKKLRDASSGAAAVVEVVDHPQHYGGDTVYEVIKVIEAWGLGFHLGNAVKYIARAGKKQGAAREVDLAKALWYIERYREQADGEQVRMIEEMYEGACTTGGAG